MDSGFILYETVEEMPLPILPYFSREPVCKKISLVGQVLIPFVAGKTKSEDVTKYSTTAFFEVNLDYTSADIDEDTISSSWRCTTRACRRFLHQSRLQKRLNPEFQMPDLFTRFRPQLRHQQ